MGNEYFDSLCIGVPKPRPVGEAATSFWRKEDPVFAPAILGVGGEVIEMPRLIKGGMFGPQRQWWDLPNFVKQLLGGYGCVAGHTRILDPTTGLQETAEVLAERGTPLRVLSLMPDGTRQVCAASPPYLKGTAELFEVTLDDGRRVTVTAVHRFLTPAGWRTLGALRGGCLLGCSDGSSVPTLEPTKWLRVCTIRPVGVGRFYDLTVPGPANYLAEGIWHHNSGKTSSLAKRAIALALQNAPAPVALVSPTFTMARQTMVVAVRSLLAGRARLCGGAFTWKYNKSSHEFTFSYHGRTATIIIYSGEDPDALKGPNLAAAGIDEPFIQEEAVFHQMVARVRHPEAKCKEIFLGGTPEGMNSWGYELCQGELFKKHNVGLVTASTRSNLALDPGYVGRLENSFTGKAAEAYIEGRLVNLSAGLVFYGFNPSSPGPNVMELPIPEGAELGCGMDFNVNPMAACVFWRAGNHMHVVETFELPNADTELMCEVLAERYVGEDRVTRQQLREIFPDASGNARKTAAPEGKSDFSYIRAAGFEIRANSENPKRKDSWNAVNGKLAPKVGAPTLTVSPRCTNLIKYLAILSHEKLNKQKHLSHLCDAFRYPVSYLFPVVRERAQVIQLDGF